MSLMKMYNNNSTVCMNTVTHTHTPNVCGGWREQKSQRQNGKAVWNQYGFLCVYVCACVCVCEGEILKQKSSVCVSS